MALRMRFAAMKTLLLLSVAWLASCGGDSAYPAMDAAQAPAHAKPAPPPLPGSDVQPVPEAQALQAARRMGPGSCDDLRKIRGLPMKTQFGFDPYYDRIMAHADAYAPCLLRATADTTATDVVVSNPGVSIETIGDLAFVLLVRGGKVAWGDCTPVAIREKEKSEGAAAFYAWLKQPGAREQWHDCLVRAHGA